MNFLDSNLPPKIFDVLFDVARIFHTLYLIQHLHLNIVFFAGNHNSHVANYTLKHSIQRKRYDIIVVQNARDINENPLHQKATLECPFLFL